MPKRKTTNENNILYQNMNNSPRDYLNEPVTLHIMKEMDVKPLNPFIDECIYEPDTLNEKKPLQTVNGSKRRMLVIPEKNPSFKAYRDDFVLLQKSPTFQSPEDNFSKLSDEIILHIFQWLPKSTLVKCAEVCKRWKNISYDESLWSRYDFAKKLIQPGVLEILILRGISVLRLATSEIKSPIFHDLEFTSRQRFSKLRYLDLSMATLPVKSLADLLAVCNMLKKLSLEACRVNYDCCKYIAQNKDLEVLNMTMCYGVTAAGLKEITTNCVKLKEWNLSWTHLNKTCMKTFLPLLPNCLMRFSISGNPLTLDDNALLKIVDRCPNLIELDISDCHAVTEASFMTMLEVCKNLEHLHVSRCFNIPTDCNRYLRNLKNFKRLEIFRTLTDEAEIAMQKYLPHIKVNSEPFSTIARPTTGIKRTSIWGLRVRE